ncbi:MAG TPA: MoaD/ThiS family protein [Firmicutes bacterium]|nr:MoaD/ThiS family protein [Bacillota bacterium]
MPDGTVKVEFLSFFRTEATDSGVRGIDVQWRPGMTVGDALWAISAQLRPPFQRDFIERLEQSEVLQALVLLNGKPVRALGGLRTSVVPGDILSLVPPMEGG